MLPISVSVIIHGTSMIKLFKFLLSVMKIQSREKQSCPGILRDGDGVVGLEPWFSCCPGHVSQSELLLSMLLCCCRGNSEAG